MKLKNLFAVCFIMTILITFSCQEGINDIDSEPFMEATQGISKRICLTEEHMQSLLQNPEYRKQREKMLHSFEKFKSQNNYKANCTSPAIVPVAIHFQGVNNPNPSCLQSLAIDQIDRLNKDYNGENADISNWSNQAVNQFPGVTNGEMCVQFVIADQNHPSGYGLNNGDLAITINRTQGDQENNWAGYVNIFVQRNTGYLGYAPLGGSGNGDGVVIDASAFGGGQGCGEVAPEAPFDLGRTLTHEMGHYLLLDHIWGNGCGVDDEVGDTPEQSSDYAGCPNLGASSCGSVDMHMNYMDYTDDACMYMFSGGQETRMNNFLLSNLGSVTGNAANVYSGGGGGNGGGTGDECHPPSGITANVQSDQIVLINWSDVSNSSGYNVQYRRAGDSGFTTISVDASQATLSGLDPGTEYDVRVRTNCAANSSSYTAIFSFNTTDNSGGSGNECVTPASSNVQIRNASSVSIDWEDVTDALRYQVRYRIQGSASWNRKNTTNSSRVLNNLQPEIYEYKLRTRCPQGWTEWSSLKTFDLGAGGGNEPSGSFKIRVTLDDYGSETSWELYNASNTPIKLGGPYQDGQNGTIHTTILDLTDGCYEIDLYDAFGDGICCDYGYGSFEVLDQNEQQLAYSDGNFGTYELIAFCVTNGNARITKRDKDAKTKLRGKVKTK